MDKKVINKQLGDDELEKVSGGSYGEGDEVYYMWDEDRQELVEFIHEFVPPDEEDGEPILTTLYE